MSLLISSAFFRLIFIYVLIFSPYANGFTKSDTARFCLRKQVTSVTFNKYVVRHYSSSQVSKAENESKKASIEGDKEKTFVRGQLIKVVISKFGPLGASVKINNDTAVGLALQSEISYFRDKRGGEDVVIGEEIDGYVERVRDDGRIDVSLRPIGLNRIQEIKQIVLDALEGSPSGIIPVGDKSSSRDISAYFHGISKTDFKNAVGALYREGKALPGAHETSFVPEDARINNAVKPKTVSKDNNDLSQKKPTDNIDISVRKESVSKIKPPRLPSDRDVSKSIFIGNLPFTVNEKIVMNTLSKKLGKGKHTNQVIIYFIILLFPI
jgi:hypothetical protein